MSDISITNNSGVFDANDLNTAKERNYVCFQSDTDCTVCFEDPNVFKTPSITLVANVAQDLKIHSRSPTNFTVVAAGTPCESAQFDGITSAVHVIVIS